MEDTKNLLEVITTVKPEALIGMLRFLRCSAYFRFRLLFKL